MEEHERKLKKQDVIDAPEEDTYCLSFNRIYFHGATRTLRKKNHGFPTEWDLKEKNDPHGRGIMTIDTHTAHKSLHNVRSRRT